MCYMPILIGLHDMYNELLDSKGIPEHRRLKYSNGLVKVGIECIEDGICSIVATQKAGKEFTMVFKYIKSGSILYYEGSDVVKLSGKKCKFVEGIILNILNEVCTLFEDVYSLYYMDDSKSLIIKYENESTREINVREYILGGVVENG